MSRMEFLDQNILDTTTMLTLQSNTDGASKLFDRQLNKAYASSGYNGITATLVTVAFAQTTTISRILLQSHNLKTFRVFYNGVTANVITVSAGGDTTTTNWATNSETSHYLKFSDLNVTSISVQMDAAITTGSEKRIGELVVCDLKMAFAKNPNRAGYDPELFSKQVVHEMSDGGTTIFDIKDKFRAKIRNDYITASERDDLKDLVYTPKQPFYFVPFPTGTAWDGDAYEVVWVGKFDGIRPIQNNRDAGFTAEFEIRETPN